MKFMRLHENPGWLAGIYRCKFHFPILHLNACFGSAFELQSNVKYFVNVDVIYDE